MVDTQLIGNADNSGAANSPSDKLYLQRFLAIAGTLNYIRAKCGVGHAMFGLYQDSSGVPGSLYVSTPSTAVVAGWNWIPITNYILVTDRYYWLAFNCDYAIQYKSATGKTIRYKSITYDGFTFPSPPSGLSSDTTFDFQISGWNYTPPAIFDKNFQAQGRGMGNGMFRVMR